MQYANITTQTTTVVAKGPALLATVTISTGATSAVATVYDNASAGSGTKIATIDASTSRTLAYLSRCKNGITIVTSGGNADITVGYD